MFSFVRSIGSIKPSEARVMSAHGREKKSSGKFASGDDSSETSENENIFSIQALIRFLEDFLENTYLEEPGKKYVPSSTNPDNSPETLSFAPWMKTEHSNVNTVPPLSQKVAHAYAHGADVMKGILPQNPVTSTTQRNRENAYDVYHLLKDLRALRNSGLVHVHLNESLTFLDGIRDAIYRTPIR